MDRLTLKKIINSQYTIYIAISFLTAATFCLIYGVRILNPTYTDWLMNGGDTTQHFLGWKAYRAGKWTFPIGYTDTLSYPTKTSVIFTDSIPCFAVIFKMLSPLLPTEFQYFGLWGIMCFILQGIFAARIIKHFTGSKHQIIIASVMFAFSTPLIQRMYGHTALAGQWIILFALETIFAYQSYYKSRKICVIWAIIGLLAPSIHIYYVLICGIILAGYCIADMASYKRFDRSLHVIAAYLLTAESVTWILGGFSSNVAAANDGLGKYSANLNTLFNPQGFSCILPTLPLYGTGQGD